MKVILLQNVPKLGQKGDIKNVNDGHVRNYLLPRKLVKIATNQTVAALENEKKKSNEKEQALHNKVHGILSQINGKSVEIKEKANEKGHLFAQVHVKEIADAIGDLGFEISEDWIDLEDSIKETGEHKINLEAYGEKARLSLIIVGE